MTKQTMWLWHCCQNILPAWRIMWVKMSQKWVMMCSLCKHNSTAIVKWWCNIGKGVIRVKMDDNKGGHLTHHACPCSPCLSDPPPQLWHVGEIPQWDMVNSWIYAASNCQHSTLQADHPLSSHRCKCQWRTLWHCIADSVGSCSLSHTMCFHLSLVSNMVKLSSSMYVGLPMKHHLTPASHCPQQLHPGSAHTIPTPPWMPLLGTWSIGTTCRVLHIWHVQLSSKPGGTSGQFQRDSSDGDYVGGGSWGGGT